MNISEEHIINLLSQYCKGELGVEAQEELIQILKDPEGKKQFARYHKIYQEGRSEAFLKQLNQEAAWQKISARTRKVKILQLAKRKPEHWLPYAAAIVIFALVGYFLIDDSLKRVDYTAQYNFEELVDVEGEEAMLQMADGSVVNLQEKQQLELAEADGTKIYKDSTNSIRYTQNTDANKTALLYNKVFVPKGGEYQLSLGDGSLVILNADSELKFPTQFDPNKREVYLKGEAFFQIAHHSKAPFVVHAYDSKVKVLGTQFNVSAYRDQEFIATTLVKGSVQVDNLGRSALLKRGEQSKIYRGKEEIAVKQVDTDLYTSWIHGVYEFENTELQYIMAQLSRWYNVKFFFEKEAYKSIRFTGAIERENSFEYALQLIGKVADVHFAIRDGCVVVGKK
ncbi:FecR family protein [Marinifilum caeruleilacunae]|uniref:DUF4974 domain-containing protein n=1 Tax=Marinifilum caeruleilacunae TaxID=2499076 RepID=A0ABX1WU45_9BACT|nr:FecR family protein [Marinifilum caeruleilacunae]NOU59607.1 DUF4974 domain-containing protein [Marinifilum caeruleilacunae]